MNPAEDLWVLKVAIRHFRIKNMDLLGMVNMEDMLDTLYMVDNMDMVDNVNIVDIIDIVIMPQVDPK